MNRREGRYEVYVNDDYECYFWGKDKAVKEAETILREKGAAVGEIVKVEVYKVDVLEELVYDARSFVTE